MLHKMPMMGNSTKIRSLGQVLGISEFSLGQYRLHCQSSKILCRKLQQFDAMQRYYIGVDVGTSSVRAALVASDGKLLCSATQSITIWESEADCYEQSSEEIWEACCKVIRVVTENVDGKQIGGIGFDATCSLVLLDNDFNPLSVSSTGSAQCNVIMWMDHRAAKQAEFINSTNHPLLRYVGGCMSLEMQLPKLLWIKQNLKETWRRAGHFFDLPDYLTWRATGELSRSLCSVVCKWSMEADGKTCGWDGQFFIDIGLEELAANEFMKIGNNMRPPGDALGSGLSQQAASETGLVAQLPVATSIIDAHAGGLGCLACHPSDGQHAMLKSLPLTNKLALVCGTSTCHMTVSADPVFVPGVWGPYYSVMVPGFWTNEGGQSATGKLLDHVLTTHPSFHWVKDDAESRQVHVSFILNEVLEFIAARESIKSISLLTRHFHVWPDYHGNRSPLADPTTSGMVCGLRLTSGVEDLAVQYLATVQALAYGTRHIISVMKAAGSQSIELIVVCGGLAKNSLYVQSHADILGVPLVLPNNEESVLLGSAILAACASKDFPDIPAAMEAMSGCGQLIEPNADLAKFHHLKYQVFLEMMNNQKSYQRIMETFSDITR